MTSQERISLALAHKEADRIAIHDGPWGTTVERWRKEGLPAGVGPDAYFDYELVGAGADTSFQLPGRTLEETEDYVTASNANGAIMKNWKKRTSTPELVGFTITTRQLWEEHRARLATNPSRIDVAGARAAMQNARKQGKFFIFSSIIGYDMFSSTIGPETLLPAMLEDPAWPAEMFAADAELVIACAEELLGQGLEFDGAFLYDDLGYKNGTFFSPRVYRELLFPTHKKLFSFFNARKMPVILHSCGRVTEFIPMLIEAGLSCLQPLEVKAGMDLIALKQQFGDALSFMGGIDVRAMANPDPAVIEREISEKIPFAKQGGGYIYHSDHSVPDNVSFQQYCRVIELVKQYGSYSGQGKSQK